MILEYWAVGAVTIGLVFGTELRSRGHKETEQQDKHFYDWERDGL